MKPEQWKQIKQAFEVVLELDSERRAIYLDSFCPTEPELRREVESLLRHHHEAGTMMDKPAKITPAVVGDAEDEQDPWIGRNIGPYQTVARIGQGGMGAVYRAIRVDDHYLKHVAIKLVRSGYATNQYLRRFRNERQIMASLEHPNIARLLDGGATEDGMPYLVMEYIEGQPIDEYCDTRRLNTIDRLKLFDQVCSAVQYAHQSLIIHRDLKPANILVTTSGTPKLLDFGIAKLLDPELFFQTTQDGMTMGRAMTPEYASPEQVRGDPITTASDVYSLGVILYRLLTGHPPYRVDTNTPLEIARAVSEAQPEKPSAVIDRVAEITDHDGQTIQLTPEQVSKVRDGRPAILRRRLTGDLDNIILKALRKEPARRYPSVEQFVEDIRRNLNGLPISARPDTIFYRTGKLVRRHKIPVIAAVLVLLSLLTGIVLTARQARIANAERARAERRFNDVRKLARDLIFEVHDSIEHLTGATAARKLIVEDALSYLNNLSKESAGDISLQEELATAYEKVGDAQGMGSANLGDTTGALESYRKALAIRESISAAKPGDLTSKIGLSRAYSRMGSILQHMGKFTEAQPYLEHSLEIRKQLHASAPNNQHAQEGLAAAHDELGDLLVDMAQWEPYLEHHRASAALYESLASTYPDSSAYRGDVALQHKKIGGGLEVTGKLPEALKEYVYALQIDEGLAAKHPEIASNRRGVAIDYSSVGDVLLKTGDSAAALKRYRQALTIDNELAAADPKNASERLYIVYDSHRAADALLQTGDAAGAIALYTKTATLAQANAEADPENMEAKSELARTWSKLGAAHFFIASQSDVPPVKKTSSLQAARGWYQKSLKVWLSLQEQKALQGADQKMPEEAQAALAKCESALRETS